MNNSSFYSNYSNDGQDGDEMLSFMYDPRFRVTITVGLALIVTIGCLGNAVVIFTLLFTRAHRQTTTSAFVLNLSFADLLFLIFCVPFHGVLYLLNNWPFGLVMCKLAHFCQSATTYATVWLLTVMSVDRYLAIGHPIKSVKWRNPTQARNISIVVWFVSLILSLPWFWLYGVQYFKDYDRTACYAMWPDPLYEIRHWFFLAIFLSGFAIPSFIIFVMALLVAGTLAGTLAQPLVPEGTPGGHRAMNIKRKRVAWLVFALSFVFFICWFPQNISIMWMSFGNPTFDSSFYVYKLISHIFTYLNSCVNPLLYSLVSEQFRTKLIGAVTGRRYLSSRNGQQTNRQQSHYMNHSHLDKSEVARTAQILNDKRLLESSFDCSVTR